MIILKLGIVLQTHAAQHSRYRSFPRRQYGAYGQHLHHVPYPVAERLRKWGKYYHDLFG
jgi:hypothetical protein